MEEKKARLNKVRFSICQKIAIAVCVQAVLLIAVLFTIIVFFEQEWAVPFWMEFIVNTWFSIIPFMKVVFWITLVYGFIKLRTQEGKRILIIYLIGFFCCLLTPQICAIIANFLYLFI